MNYIFGKILFFFLVISGSALLAMGENERILNDVEKHLNDSVGLRREALHGDESTACDEESMSVDVFQPNVKEPVDKPYKRASKQTGKVVLPKGVGDRSIGEAMNNTHLSSFVSPNNNSSEDETDRTTVEWDESTHRANPVSESASDDEDDNSDAEVGNSLFSQNNNNGVRQEDVDVFLKLQRQLIGKSPHSSIRKMPLPPVLDRDDSSLVYSENHELPEYSYSESYQENSSSGESLPDENDSVDEPVVVGTNLPLPTEGNDSHGDNRFIPPKKGGGVSMTRLFTLSTILGVMAYVVVYRYWNVEALDERSVLLLPIVKS